MPWDGHLNISKVRESLRLCKSLYLWKKPRDLVSRILQQNFNKALGKLIFYISIQLMFNFVIKISLVHFAYSWANPIYVCSGLLALIFRSAIVNFSEKLCSNTEPYYIYCADIYKFEPCNRPFPFWVKFWSRQVWTKI
jgi:hypothetical protein